MLQRIVEHGNDVYLSHLRRDQQRRYRAAKVAGFVVVVAVAVAVAVVDVAAAVVVVAGAVAAVVELSSFVVAERSFHLFLPIL